MPTTIALAKANDPCWCGSGRKFKRCHKASTDRIRPGRVSPPRPVPADIARPPYADTGGPLRHTDSHVRSPEVIERMRRSGRVAAEVLQAVGAAVAPGVTTDELDALCHEECIRRGGYPSPLNYGAFPKSLCTSVNEVICHGIPDDRPLVDGDIVNLECLDLGIGQVRPGNQFRQIGRAIQTHAEGLGYGVVRAFVGHGIAEQFHTDLQIPHYENRRAATIIEPGMTFTIEPMITMGSWQHQMWDDGWTAVTTDRRRTAQFEHTLLVTDTGA